MRGQRPTPPVLLAWLVLLALLLVSVPALHSHADDGGFSAASMSLPLPSGDGSGEDRPQEPEPAKLRRAPAAPTREDTAAVDGPALLVNGHWSELALLAVLVKPVPATVWPRASAGFSAQERPGRRVQRGQAPPQA